MRVSSGPIGGPLRGQDRRALAEPIQPRGRHLRIPKHLDPCAEGAMARYHRGALAVAFSQDVKEGSVSKVEMD